MQSPVVLAVDLLAVQLGGQPWFQWFDGKIAEIDG
jgi:hypothetical protein